MKNLNRFYTYAYLREDRTPYYIGKGEGKRVYKRHQKGISVPKDKSRIIFLKQNLIEEEAFKHEIYMIAVLGRKDLGTGILRNRTNGGDGHSGYIASEECRKKRSLVNMGRKFWTDVNGNMKFSKECPGEGWFLGTNENSKKKKSLAKKGKKGRRWWTDVNGNMKFTKECPGIDWIPGRSEEHKKKRSLVNNGRRWWNDGCGNRKFVVECPGENWILGMSVRNDIQN